MSRAVLARSRWHSLPGSVEAGPTVGTVRRALESPGLMVLVALTLRVGLMSVLRSYELNPYLDYFNFGGEAGRIARSLVRGEGFASPFHEPTGPTAVIAPLYPLLLAGIFALFGIYTTASSWVALALNSLFSAVTCLTVFFIAKKTFGLRVAVWAGWVWAVLPSAVFWPTRLVWETSLSTLLFSLCFLLALHLGASAGVGGWLGFGALWGLTGLSNPSLLAFFPFCLGWMWYRHRGQRRAAVLLAGVVLMVACAVLPWTLRNYVAFGRLVPLRSSMGLALLMGNQEGATGLAMWWVQPVVDAAEMAKFRRLGELAYMEEKEREALRFIAEHPGTFALLSLKRVGYFWFGTPDIDRLFGAFGRLGGAKRAFFVLSSLLPFVGLVLMIAGRRPGAFLFASSLLVYPVLFYVTMPLERYRHPIEPQMVVLAIFAVLALMAEVRRKLGSA